MGKNKKITLLILYLIVIFLWIFDLLYYWMSIKQQVMHYNILTRFIYGENLTYFSEVYFWAYILFLIIPIVFVCYSKKNMRTIALGVVLFVLHLIIGTICESWMVGMDNDGTYDSFGHLYRYEQSDGNLTLCIQEVYLHESGNPEDTEAHSIIFLQTGNNTLKKIRELDFTAWSYHVSWESDRAKILLTLYKKDELTKSPFIDISYDELKRFAELYK